jgi:hypothetical protein
MTRLRWVLGGSEIEGQGTSATAELPSMVSTPARADPKLAADQAAHVRVTKLSSCVRKSPGSKGGGRANWDKSENSGVFQSQCGTILGITGHQLRDVD